MPSLATSLTALRRHVDDGAKPPGRRKLAIVLADYDRVCAQLADEPARCTLPAPPSGRDETTPALRRRSFTASGPYPGLPPHFTDED